MHAGISTRKELLEAATRIVLRDGPGHLTLDAVARESGPSKGGVLYHFPTKDALIAALIDDLCERFDREVEEAVGQAPGYVPTQRHQLLPRARRSTLELPYWQPSPPTRSSSIRSAPGLLPGRTAPRVTGSIPHGPRWSGWRSMDSGSPIFSTSRRRLGISASTSS